MKNKLQQKCPAILGIGLALPPYTLKQHETAQIACDISRPSHSGARVLKAFYEKTSIQKRGSVLLERVMKKGDFKQTFFSAKKHTDDLGPGTKKRMLVYEEEAPKLALRASKRALADAKVKAGDITHLVLVSCTGFSSPGIDVRLIRGLKLRPDIERAQIGFMGCHGVINGLRVAKALAAQNAKHKVLLCSVEIASIHYSYGKETGALIANALFADGASACVIASTPKKSSWSIHESGSCIFPDSEDAMSWRIGDHGFEMSLSAKIPSLIQANLKPWLSRWLAKNGMSLQDVKSWAIHPGGPRVLEAVTQSLSIPESAATHSRIILQSCGNMSSATILFILERMQRVDAPLPCVAIGFGPGLAAEAALFV